MPTQIVDDTDAAISYSAGWSVQRVSGRQWDGTATQTFSDGASAVLRFRGTRVRVFVTVLVQSDPLNPGQQVVDITLDSRAPERVSRDRGPENVYNDQWFDSGDVPDTEHTITLVNASGAFALDRFQLDGSPVSILPKVDPSITSPIQGAQVSDDATISTTVVSVGVPVRTTDLASPMAMDASTNATTTTRLLSPPNTTPGSHITSTSTSTVRNVGGPTSTVDSGLIPNTRAAKPWLVFVLGGLAGLLMLILTLYVLYRLKRRRMEKKSSLLPESFPDDTQDLITRTHISGGTGSCVTRDATFPGGASNKFPILVGTSTYLRSEVVTNSTGRTGGRSDSDITTRQTRPHSFRMVADNPPPYEGTSTGKQTS